jgi:hypothetical protein
VTHEILRELFAGQAEWRAQKLKEHPDDQRNRVAVEIFQRLAETAADVPQSLLDAYDAAFLRWDTHDVIASEQMMLRSVGFRNAPESAEAYLRDFLDLVAFEHRREAYRPKFA